jgi:hypothetical protein
MVQGNSEAMPIISSLIGKSYDETNLQKIVNALKGVSTENVRNVLKAENSL